MNKVFIIEGIDHVGKSTIIKEMRREEEGIVIHSGMPLVDNPNKCENDPLQHNRMLSINQGKYFQRHVDLISILSNHVGSIPNIYLDRFHLGEYVYSKYRSAQDPKRLDNSWSRTFIFNKIDTELDHIHGDNIKIYLILLDFTDIDAMRQLRTEDHNNKYGDKFENIIKDREDFQTAYEFSRLNKRHIFVNNTDYKWIDRKRIVSQIML